jgi:hypothetical protein
MNKMKQLVNAGLLATGILVITACGNNVKESNETMNDHSAHENTSAANMPATVNIKDDKVNALHEHYVHLTTALTNGDAGEAKIAANAIEAGAKETPGAEKVAGAAAKLAAENDIEKQRTIYAGLSDDFIALVKKAGVTGGELYVDFCPMALNDKGAYWLSKNKDIRNPYFGNKMMTCGEVKETIGN